MFLIKPKKNEIIIIIINYYYYIILKNTYFNQLNIKMLILLLTKICY